ncbi:hypothetical protein [Caudoviricetes sp.]|nr:hypothetical protein [Caudoviricetes sp.]
MTFRFRSGIVLSPKVPAPRPPAALGEGQSGETSAGGG